MKKKSSPPVSKQKFQVPNFFLHAFFFLVIITSIFSYSRIDQDHYYYYCYANIFWHGTATQQYQFCLPLLKATDALPINRLPPEYPILSLIPFSLPMDAPPFLHRYTFSFYMAIIATAIYVILYKHGKRGASFAYTIYLLLGSLALATQRFDVIPSLLVLLCLLFAQKKRFILAYLALSLAIMFKLYALPLVGVLFIAEQKWYAKTIPLWYRLRGIALCAGICMGLILFSFVLDTTSNVYTRLLNRPIEIESTPASAVWVLSQFGKQSCTELNYGSLNIYQKQHGICQTGAEALHAPLLQNTVLFFELIQITGFGYVLYVLSKNRLTLPQSFLAILLILVSTGKIFSPQFLLWIIPIIAYTEGVTPVWFIWWSSICLLTTILFPFLFTLSESIHNVSFIFFTAAIRNSLVSAFTIFYLMKKLARLRSG